MNTEISTTMTAKRLLLGLGIGLLVLGCLYPQARAVTVEARNLEQWQGHRWTGDNTQDPLSQLLPESVRPRFIIKRESETGAVPITFTFSGDGNTSGIGHCAYYYNGTFYSWNGQWYKWSSPSWVTTTFSITIPAGSDSVNVDMLWVTTDSATVRTVRLDVGSKHTEFIKFYPNKASVYAYNTTHLGSTPVVPPCTVNFCVLRQYVTGATVDQSVGYTCEINGSAMLSASDLVDLPSIVSYLNQASPGVFPYLKGRLSSGTRTLLANYPSNPSGLLAGLVTDFNAIINGVSIYEAVRFTGIVLRTETDQLRLQNPPAGSGLIRLNRLLLEDVFSTQIKRVAESVFSWSGSVTVGGPLSGVSDTEWANVPITIPAGMPNGRLVFNITPGTFYARALKKHANSLVSFEIEKAPYREIVVIGGTVDSDGDGLSDYQEVHEQNTDPDKYSTDGDILSDGFEVRAGGTGNFDALVAKTFTTAELDADADGDRLSLLQEIRYNTNPNSRNSDSDTVEDGDEVDWGTDPMDSNDSSTTTLQASDYQEVDLYVGDHSASHSERYVLKVGNIHHQAASFGDMSGWVKYKFRVNKSYSIQLIHAAGPGTDFDWTADLSLPGAASLSGDYQAIFKVQGDDSSAANPVFAAKGKRALYTPGGTGGMAGPPTLEVLNPEQCVTDYQQNQGTVLSAPPEGNKMRLVVRRGFGASTDSAQTVYLKFSGTAVPGGHDGGVIYRGHYDIDYPVVMTIPVNGIVPVTIPAQETVKVLGIRLMRQVVDACMPPARWAYNVAPYTFQATLSESSGGAAVGSVSGKLSRWKVSVARSTTETSVPVGGTAHIRFTRSDNGSCFPSTPEAPVPFAFTAHYSTKLNDGPWVHHSFYANTVYNDIAVAVGSAEGLLRVRVEPGPDYVRAVKAFFSGASGGYEESGMNPSEAVVLIGNGDSTLDSDDDGLTDYEELMTYGTDPESFDTDGDLLPDKFEVDYSSSPANLNPLVPDNLDSDADRDGLTLFDEMVYGGNPGDTDTDDDGVSDKVEADQGSDPSDRLDRARRPDSEMALVSITVGDPSGSQSERYVLKVGNINHQSRGFGDVYTKAYKMRRGKTYPFSIKHAGTDPAADLPEPDLDWIAGISVTDLTANPIDILATTEDADPPILISGDSEVNTFPSGSGTLFIPLSTTPDEEYYRVYLVPDWIEANGKGKSQAVLDPETGGVAWSIVEQGDEALGCSIDQTSGRITCSGYVSGRVTVRASKAGSPVQEAVLTVKAGCGSCASGNCGPGAGTVANSSVDMDISLGKADYGETPISLRLKESEPGAAIAAGSLKLSGRSPQVQVNRLAGGQINQVRTPTVLACVIPTASGYDVKLYRAYNTALGLASFPVDATTIANNADKLFCTWSVTRQAVSDVLVTEYSGVTPIHKHYYRYDGLNGTHHNWTLQTEWTGSGDTYRRQGQRAWSGAVETHTVSDISATPALLHTESRTYSADYPLEVVQETLGTVGTMGTDAWNAWGTTTWQYYLPTAPVVASRGLVQTVQGPSGWERYYYAADGRPSRVVTQMGDNAMPSDGDTANENLNRVKTIGYSRVDGWPVEETLVKAYSAGLQALVEVSHTYRRFLTEAESGTAFDVEELIQCQNRGVTSPDADGNLHTKTYTYPAGHPFAFRTRKITKPDGTMVLYEYQEDAVAKTLKTTTWEGKPDAGFAKVTDGTKTERTVDRAGNLRLEEVYAVAADVATRVAKTETVSGYFDSLGRPTKLVYEDTSSSQMSYGCCGLQSSTDRAGVTTWYDYDKGKRLEFETVTLPTPTPSDLKTHSVYDAAGRLDFVEQYNFSAQAIRITTKDYGYDDASRVTSLAEPMRNPNETTGTTLYTHSVDAGHRVLTTRYPNLSTKREVYAKDGKLLRVDGAAAHPVEYEYGVDSDGEYVKEIRIRGTGASEVKTEWVKTYQDLLGRPWKTVYPTAYRDFTENLGTPATRTYSPTTGQLVRATDPDGVVQLFEYDGQGKLARQAVDVNLNGLIEEGIDQVTQSASSWVSPPPGGGTLNVNQTESAEWKDAAGVTIGNPSFESASLSPWVGTGSSGVATPTAGHYPQGIPNGVKVAYLGPSAGSISEGGLGATAANHQYQLKLRLGHRSGVNYPTTVTVKLKQGTTVLVSQNAPAVPAGTFATVELEYVAAVASTEHLGIEISTPGNGIVDVDQVELVKCERVVTGTAVASASGSYSAQTGFGQTTTRQFTYTPASYKLTETVNRPDTSSVVSEYIHGRLRFVTVYANSGGTRLAKTEYQYDNFGRVQNVVETRDTAQNTTTYGYYNDGRIAMEVSPVPESGQPQLTSTYTYNDFVADGRTLTVTLPDLSLVNYKFRLTGELRSLSGSQKTPAEYDYDEQGRLKTITTWRDLSTAATKAATKEETIFTYDANRGFMTTKTINGAGHAYDFYNSGRVRTRTWNRGISTAYAYNSAGALWKVDYSDVNGSGTPDVIYAYDSRGRAQTVTDPTGIHTYTYRDDGQVTAEAHSGAGSVLNGLSMNWGYETTTPSRLNSITAKVGTSTLFAQGLGYRAGCSMLGNVWCNNGSANSYVTYDYRTDTALPQTISHRQGSETATPVFTTTLNHDALNRLRGLTHGSTTAPNFSAPAFPDVGYDALSRKHSVTLSEGAQWDYGYDDRGQLQEVDKTWSDGLPVAGQQFGYVYDQAGNRTRALRDGQGATARESRYNADNANQYADRTTLGYVNIIGTANPGTTVSATVGGTTYRAEQHGTYFRCEVGPVTRGADSQISIRGVKPNGSTDYISTDDRTVTVPPATQDFDYDTDGNLMDDDVWSYTWDGENRLKEMVRANHTKLTFDYDYAGRRVRKSVQAWVTATSDWGTAQITRYLYDGWHLVAELAATDTLVRGYVWGLTAGGALDSSQGVGALVMVRSGSTVHFVTQDPFGNVAGLVNATSGALEGRFEYTPFGELLQASGTPTAIACPIRFSNQYWDSESGLSYYGYRYYSPSLGRWINRDPIGESGGENLYGFVLNSPLEFIDILGREPGRFGSPDGDHSYYRQTHQNGPGPLVPAIVLSVVDKAANLFGRSIERTEETDWFLKGDAEVVKGTERAKDALSKALNGKLCGKVKGMPRLSFLAGPPTEGNLEPDWPVSQTSFERSFVIGFYEYRVVTCGYELDGNRVRWNAVVAIVDKMGWERKYDAPLRDIHDFFNPLPNYVRPPDYVTRRTRKLIREHQNLMHNNWLESRETFVDFYNRRLEDIFGLSREFQRGQFELSGECCRE